MEIQSTIMSQKRYMKAVMKMKSKMNRPDQGLKFWRKDLVTSMTVKYHNINEEP